MRDQISSVQNFCSKYPAACAAGYFYIHDEAGADQWSKRIVSRRLRPAFSAAVPFSCILKQDTGPAAAFLHTKKRRDCFRHAVQLFYERPPSGGWLCGWDEDQISSASTSCSQAAAEASEGMRQSPRGERVTEPTLGPSGRQERLNCWAKKRR